MAQTWAGRSSTRIMWIALLALAFPATAQELTGDAFQLKKLGAEFHKAGKDGEAIAVAKRAVELAEQHKEAKGVLSSALGHLAWYALFARQPKEALAASEQAINLAPHTLWLKTNHAHALLFLG